MNPRYFSGMPWESFIVCAILEVGLPRQSVWRSNLIVVSQLSAYEVKP